MISGNGKPGVFQRIYSKTQEMEKILERASRLYQLPPIPGLFGVTDLSEDEDQICATFECPRGTCLAKYMETHEKITQEWISRSFSYLLITLDKLEKSGLCDLAVTPDKLYIQDDGCMWFFPELRKDPGEMADYTYTVSGIMYNCLTGKTVPDKAVRILFDELEPLDEADPEGDTRLHKIIEKGLETDPDLAYRTPLEFAEALKNRN